MYVLYTGHANQSETEPLFQLLLKTAFCLECHFTRYRTNKSDNKNGVDHPLINYFFLFLLLLHILLILLVLFIYILYKRKKFKQMGQNVHFQTDTFILLLKFRYKLIAGKSTRQSCNGLQRTQINSADKKWKKLRSTRF